MTILLHYMRFCILSAITLHSKRSFVSSFSSSEGKTRQLRARTLNQTSTTSNDVHQMNRKLDGIIDGVDLCLNGPNDYGQCNPNRFPACDQGFRLCMYRQPRSDLFYDKLRHDPVYYIEYDKAECVPVYNNAKHRKWNCNLCDPGVWCESLNRCTKHKKRFCPDDCNKAKFRRWCPSKLKCLRYQDVDGKRKEECPDWK